MVWKSSVMRMAKAVAEHTRRVSTRTPRDCAIPCLTGWEVSAEEEMFGRVPIPASLENIPLRRPMLITVPMPPPTREEGLNAPPMMAERAGMKFPILQIMMMAHMMSQIKAIYGTAHLDMRAVPFIPKTMAMPTAVAMIPAKTRFPFWRSKVLVKALQAVAAVLAVKPTV